MKLNGTCGIAHCQNKVFGRSDICKVHSDFIKSQVSESSYRKTYHSWFSMTKKARCEGLEIAPEWEMFANFITQMGPKPGSHHHVLLKEGMRTYSKDNCYWGEIESNDNSKKPKLSYELAEEIREAYTNGAKMKDLAVTYGVCFTAISRIVNRQVWNNPR